MLRVAACTALACALFAEGAAQAAEKQANRMPEGDEVIILSPYEVLALKGEFENWIKVASPHYVIYTDASAEEAMGILRKLEMLHQATQVFFHRTIPDCAPLMMVLPTSRSDWRKLESRGRVEWRPDMSAIGGSVSRIAVAQYEWQAEGLYLVWHSQSVTNIDRMGFETTFWLSRGIGSLFQTAKFTDDSVTLGRLDPRVLSPGPGGWMPWERFFRVTGKSPEFTRRGSVGAYERQCAACVQFMLTSPDIVWHHRLWNWNALLRTGRLPKPEVFAPVFEMSYDEWDALLFGWARHAKMPGLKFRFTPEELDVPRRQLPVSPAEMRELFVLTQILVQDVRDSEISLDALLARELKTEALRGALAEACLAWKRPEAALRHLERMMAAGAAKAAVFSSAALIEFQRQVPVVSIGARLGSDAGRIREWCRTALELEPLDTDANTVLAWTEALGPAVDEDSLATIGKICRTMDGYASTDSVIAALAVARWRAGKPESARKACTTLLESPFAGLNARELATAVLRELDQSAPDAVGEPAPESPAPVEPTRNASEVSAQ